MIDVKCIITRKVYDSGEGYRVYSCRPVEAEKTGNLELNKYGDFTISINHATFSIGNTIHVCVEKDELSKYPCSYKFVSYYNQLGADISPETAKQIMCNFMTESQAISIIDAYPDFIRLILDNKADEIDTKKIYGVGKHRLALYQRKIKEHCKEIAYAPICYKWNIKDIRLVSGRFGSPQEFESAVNSAPYATLIDKCECSFVEADKTILKNNRELRSSEERCLYACLHELKQNELNGSTIMSTAELSHIIFDKYNACYDKLVDVVKRSSKIHYDDVCKSVARESTYQSELAIAQILLEKIKKPSKLYIELDKYREIDGITLTDEQLSAVDMVANNSVCMLNGPAGCVDCDTEFFNGHGWKRIADYEAGDKVLQYNEDGTAELVAPLAYIKQPCDFLWHFETPHSINQTVCEQHRILFKWNGYEGIKETDILTLKKKSDNNINWCGRFITQFYYFGNGISMSDEQIRVMVAVMAEGHFSTRYSGSKTKWCVVRLKKERKINRLELLLNDANIPYKKNIDKFGVTNIRFYAPERRKVYGGEWWNVNEHQARIIYEEVTNWDGAIVKSRVHGKEKPIFNTTEKQSADYIQYIFTINGWQSTIVDDSNSPSRREFAKRTYRVSTKHNTLTGLCFDNRPSKKKTEFQKVSTKDGLKYCFTVPTGMLVLRRKNCIFITGNCGKSQTIKTVVKMFDDVGATYQLLAPTGIASKVLQEYTKRPSKTCHMFLTSPWSPQYIIVDETSICSIETMRALLSSVNKDTNLIFVCDNAQLLSISCGNFVQDVIDSGLMPRVSLSKIFRYKTSGIITEVTDIRNGEHGNLTNDYADYSFVQISDEPMKQISAAYDKFLSMGYTKDDILLLCPYNKSKIGSTAINSYMQDKYNPSEETGFRAQKNGIRMHDRVINKKNNYHVIACSWSEDEQEYVDSGQMFVANGDIGEVVQYKNNDNEQYLIIRFGDRCAKFEPSDILNLQLAYCISCHSSQGCQAKAVICIFDRMHQSLVTRNLLYVAMSRAQEQLCVIGDYDTIVCGISKQENLERKTFLKNMLTNPKKYDIILST